MDPLQSLLSGLESGPDAERDLEFRVDPARVRQILTDLVKADPLLWLKHLLQLLYDVPLQGPLTLRRLPSDRFSLSFVPALPEDREALAPQSVAAMQDRLLARGKAAAMARALCEAGDRLCYSHSGGQRLQVAALSFELEGVPQSVSEHTPLTLELPARSLVPGPRLFSVSAALLGRTLQPIAGLHPYAPDLDIMKPLVPDWPFAPQDAEDLNTPELWDWETVLPAERAGFQWTVSAWGEALPPVDPRCDLTVIRHPMEIRRSLSTLPILGCYPESLAAGLSLEPVPRRSLLTVRCQRVFGVSWTATTPRKAEVFPVIRGVPGRPIILSEVPGGLYILAEAGHLRTDASGLSLVRDQDTEAWLGDLINWAKEQTELYLPYLGAIPRLWIARVRRWEEVGRPLSPWKRFWQSAVAGLFSSSPMQGMIDRRAEELSGWSRHKDWPQG
jgi:hypothetical protein